MAITLHNQAFPTVAEAKVYMQELGLASSSDDAVAMHINGATAFMGTLLSRLRLQGLVTTRLEESPTGPARKYYSLTARGRKAAEQMNHYLATLVQASRALRGRGENK